MIAKASLPRAALHRAERGTVTRVAACAAALLASLGILGEVQAQEQQQEQQQEQLQQQQLQQQQQFGPRANQARRQQQPQMPKPELVATHGDWAVQCQEAPGAAEGEAATRSCGMFQAAKSDRQGVNLTLVVVKAEQDGKEVTMLRVMAPIGVYLPTGVALEIDGDAVGRVPFTRCMPQACIAVAEASPPTLEKMKSGGVANFIIYENPGAGMAMELSLKGFTAALGELNQL